MVSHRAKQMLVWMRRFIALCVASSFLIAAPAQAKFIVLQIPVDLSNVHRDAYAGWLDCKLFNKSGDLMADRNYTSIPLINGAFRGNVRVRFLPDGYPLSANPIPDVGGYACELTLRWTCTSSDGTPGRCERTLRPGGGEADTAASQMFRRDRTKVQRFTIEGQLDPENARVLPRRLN